MKPKTIITIALLLFVAASVAYLAVKEAGGGPTGSANPPEAAPPDTAQPPAAPAAASPESRPAVSKTVVYYFHGNVRCMTCRTIEAYTKEAVESAFGDALGDGRLEWRTVNVEEPGNEHFVQDFQLTTRSVVLERIAGGRRREWKNLQDVWQLVRGTKAAFFEYIQDETRAYLEAAGS